MQDNPSMQVLVRVMSSIGLPLPPHALTASGLATQADVDAARATGRLVLHGSGDIMVNPLRLGTLERIDSPELGLALLAAARELVPHRFDLQVEYVRAISQADTSEAQLLAARLCRHARTGGRARQLADVLLEQSAVDTFLRLCRRDMLCCFISVEPPTTRS